MKVISIDKIRRQVVIDWGWVTLNHWLPPTLINQTDLSKDQVLAILETLRPEEPKAIDVPQALLDLVEPSTEADIPLPTPTEVTEEEQAIEI